MARRPKTVAAASRGPDGPGASALQLRVNNGRRDPVPSLPPLRRSVQARVGERLRGSADMSKPDVHLLVFITGLDPGLLFIGSSFNATAQSERTGLYCFILTVSTHSIRQGRATALQNQGDAFIYSQEPHGSRTGHRSVAAAHTRQRVRLRAEQRPQQAHRAQLRLGLTTESGR